MTALKLTLIGVFVVVGTVLGTYERQLRRRGRPLGERSNRLAMLFAAIGCLLVIWLYLSPL